MYLIDFFANMEPEIEAAHWVISGCKFEVVTVIDHHVIEQMAQHPVPVAQGQPSFETYSLMWTMLHTNCSESQQLHRILK